jgi:hypothetical protein
VKTRTVWAIVAATIGWRWLLAVQTPVPSEDGASYLWMAQRFASGDFVAALDEVFPPGLPLLLAPWLWFGGDAFVTAQVFGVLCAAATVLPLVAIARHVAPAGALGVACLWASGSLLARNAVEVFSEPPFLLLMALGTLAGLRGRWWLLGLAAAIAFWIRPEGLLLPVAFVLSHRRAALWSLLPAAAGVLLLAVLRWLAGHGFDPLPLLAFHEQRDDLPERGQVLANVLQVPGAWFEAFGVAGLLLFGAWRQRGERAAQALGWQCLLQIGAVCTFVVRRRFFLSAAVPVHALAAPALAALRPRWRAALVAVLVLAGGIGGYRGTIAPDRAAERDVGRWLAAQLAPDETIVSDLARVVWYAGHRPPPPRRFAAADLAAQAEARAVRFVVVGSNRDGFDELSRRLAASHARLSLPGQLDGLADARGIAVFARR